MIRIYTLEDFGFPHYSINEYGTMINLKTNKVHNINWEYGSVSLWNYETRKSTKLSLKRLMGHYFESPWSEGNYVRHESLERFNCPNFCVTEDGRVWSKNQSIYLNTSNDPRGYPQVSLTKDDGTMWYVRVHRLVALVFVDNADPDVKQQVNHIDGDKANNHYTNLEWVTPHENNTHARMNGLARSVITDGQVHEVCHRLSDGENANDVADEMGLYRHTIQAIIRGSHNLISRNYNIANRYRSWRRKRKLMNLN